MTDPEDIATTIIEELNYIVEKLAPEKVVQRKKEDEIPHDEESRELKRESDNQLEVAISTGNRDEFRAYNRLKYRFQKKMTQNKKKRMKARIENKKTMFKEVQRKIEKKTEVPTSIVDNGNVITSPQKLANLFNEFFQNKTEGIVRNFQPSGTDPIEMLSKLIPNPKRNLRCL